MIPGYQVLAARIRAELEDLERSTRSAERAWQLKSGLASFAEFLEDVSSADDAEV